MGAQPLTKEELAIADEARPKAAALRVVVEAHYGAAHRLEVLHALLRAIKNEELCAYARSIVAETYQELTGQPLRPEPDA